VDTFSVLTVQVWTRNRTEAPRSTIIFWYTNCSHSIPFEKNEFQR